VQTVRPPLLPQIEEKMRILRLPVAKMAKLRLAQA